jgi:ribulose-5-phosphate 4-epimerase/fuculose-1-phosphate aldolase
MPLLHYLPGRTDLRVEDRRNGQARHNEGGQVGDKNILKSFLIGPISSIQRVLDTNDDFNGVDTLVSVQDILTGGVGVKRDLKDQSKRQMPLLSEEDFSFYCRLLYDRHLVTGVGGNVSSRVGDKIFITPSGYSLRDIEPDRVVVVSKEGRVLAGGIPTKDAEIHLGILRSRSDIHVVCHIHGAFIVAASTLIKPGPDALPPITPGFTYFAHPLTMIPFMVPGSEGLARAAVEKFSTSSCCALLLQNHGLIVVGKDFEEAVNIAEEIDEVARVYLLTNGKAHVISGQDVRKIKKLKSNP